MRFFADLEGSQSVPPVDTSANGDAVLTVNQNQTQVSYRINVNSLQRMTVAHIHLGRRGQNGPIVAPLLSVSPAISVTRAQVMGTVSQSDLTGPLQGQSLADLIENMNAGNTYVNVHTEQHPGGEIRGQIRRVD